MLSIIIPAHNEAALIGATLAALRTATETLDLDYEILVVNDGSSDGTAAIAAAVGAGVVHVAHRQIAATRNAGAEAARGDRLLFVDADTLVDATVLAAAIAAMEGGAVGGGCRVRLAGRVRWREHALAAVLMQVLRWMKIAPGCFMFCTRAAFDAVGGFDQRWFAGEDVAMSRAMAAHGRFVLLRESVLTSDRKLRTFTVREHMRLLWSFMRSGRSVLRSREALDLWYERRNVD